LNACVLFSPILQKLVMQKPCLWNGSKRPCYLFARKFNPEALDNLLKLFTSYTSVWVQPDSLPWAVKSHKLLFLFVCKLWSPYLLGSGPKDTGTTATTVMAWSSVLGKTATAMFIEWHCPHSMSCSMYVSIVFHPTPNSLVLWRTVFLSECYTVIIWSILCRHRLQQMYHKRIVLI
jgi:hypothetical protein